MDITIHTTVLPHEDPEASLAFYRDVLGFEVRTDVGSGTMRWITVGPVGQPGTSSCSGRRPANPGITDDERSTITEMMAKGTYGWIMLATDDLDAHLRPASRPATPRSCRSRPSSRTASATARSATPPATWSASRRCAEMKTMTCKQLGGPCDLAFSGETADDVIKAAGPAPQGRGRRRRHRPRAGPQRHEGPLEAPDQGDGLVQGHQEGVRRPARRLSRPRSHRPHARCRQPRPDPGDRRAGQQPQGHQRRDPEAPADGVHRGLGLGQELAGLRHDRGGVAAADQRDLQRVRAGLHADAGAPRGRRARGADDGDHRRPGADGLRPALHGRHRHRRQRDAAHPLQPARHAVRRLAAGVLLQRRLDQRRRRGHPQEGRAGDARSGGASASSAACARAARAAARSTTST